MPTADARAQILSFAAHVGGGHPEPAEGIARRRNWIGPDGDVTEDGLALIAALDDQASTRTVFRGNF